MVSYPRRLQSGHITCYLNRTYHVLTTLTKKRLDTPFLVRDDASLLAGTSPLRSDVSDLLYPPQCYSAYSKGICQSE
jgi:hypothetical protein